MGDSGKGRTGLKDASNGTRRRRQRRQIILAGRRGLRRRRLRQRLEDYSEAAASYGSFAAARGPVEFGPSFGFAIDIEFS